jgi:hypothetical protein
MIYALAAGVYLLIAAPATMAQQSAAVKLQGAAVKLNGGADVSGRVVKSGKACTANRKLRILNAGANSVGSATSDSKGRFSASLVYSGGVYVVATRTKRCRRAESREVSTGWADLSVSITGSPSNIVSTVTNAGPDPSDPGYLNVSIASATTPPPPGQVQRFHLSIPPGGSETVVLNGCATVQGAGKATAELGLFFFGPSGHRGPYDPNTANNRAEYQFICP